MKYKALIMLCVALAVPCILPAAPSFASVSPVETKSDVYMTESLTSIDQEDSNLSSDQLCIDTNLGRSRLKSLLQDKREVVLTFDDGPHPNTTPKVLEILKKRNIKAVFFVLGLQAKKYPELVKMIHDEGHIIGNHSYGHKNLSKLNSAETKSELEKTNKLIESITGERPKYYRPPYGDANKKVRAIANEAGMSIVLWTVDTRDWASKNETAILKEIDRQLGIGKGHYRGGAILMHDIYPSTVRALNKILDKLAINDYRVSSINKLGNDDEYWSVKTPILCKKSLGIKHADPKLSGNNFMISILTKKPKVRTSHMKMLKARKEGHLLSFLAQQI